MGNKIVKKIIFFLLIFFSLNYSILAQNIQKVKISDVIRIIDTTQTPLIVNFWASWCKPCVEELPWFEKMAEENKSYNVKLLLVSLDFADDYPKALTAFVKKKGYKSEVVWLNETDANYFCNKIDMAWEGNIPVSLFINNKKQYRIFIANQVPEPRLKLEFQKLLE